MISKTAKYALRAVVYIASRSDAPKGRVPIREMADALDVSQSYLSKVMHRLGRAGVVDSVRGPGGGFWLAVRPDRLVLSRVTAPFEETGGPLPCLLADGPCDPDEPCVAHPQWKAIAGAMLEFFESTTVAELLEGIPGQAPGSIAT